MAHASHKLQDVSSRRLTIQESGDFALRIASELHEARACGGGRGRVDQLSFGQGLALESNMRKVPKWTASRYRMPFMRSSNMIRLDLPRSPTVGWRSVGPALKDVWIDPGLTTRGMELEPRSEGSDLVVFASHLKQVRTRAMGRVFGGVTSFADALELSQAWPWAKTAAAGVEAEVRQFAQPWAAAWTRAEARAWVEARGRDREVGRVGWFTGRARLARAEKTWELEAEALALAGVWAWATRVREEQQKGEKVPPMPSTLADSSTIRHTLTTLTRYGLAGDLWHCSSETRDEYSCIINFIAPITRLPFELLQQIFLITIDEAKSPPSAVMCVCKLLCSLPL